MNLQSHIENLKQRHAGLELRITEEEGRPQPDTACLARLKIQRLRLKEEIEQLQRRRELAPA